MKRSKELMGKYKIKEEFKVNMILTPHYFACFSQSSYSNSAGDLIDKLNKNSTKDNYHYITNLETPLLNKASNATTKCINEDG
jgi:hypothetical protein